MRPSKAVQKGKAEARNGRSLQQVAGRVVAIMEGPFSREANRRELHRNAADVEGMLNELRQNPQSSCDSDDHRADSEDVINEMTSGNIINDLLSLSRKLSMSRSGGGNPEGLMRRGLWLYSQPEKPGPIEDINEAIKIWKSVAASTPKSDASEAAVLCNLAYTYRSRFDQLGEVEDLSKAIEYGAQAVSLTPDGHADKSGHLSNLGISYRTRFKRLGEVADLGKAVEFGVQAVSLTPGGHDGKPEYLSNLGISYLVRFGQLGEVEDLSKAIECGAQAISLTPDCHVTKPGILNNLGLSYQTRFEQVEEMGDLNEAIKCGMNAVSLNPHGDAVKLRSLSNLGNSHRIRFERLGGMENLSKAIEYGVQVISLTPDGHADKPGDLINLGNLYHTRFQQLREVTDLNKFIECEVQAVSLAPDSHADRSSVLGNLGFLYYSRFKLLKDTSDLHKAIDCGTHAVSLAPDSYAGVPGYLNNLGLSHVARFTQLGDVADLSKAIDYGVQAVSFTPEGHTEKPGYLNNLGLSYQTRFDQLGDVADVSKAIECGAQAISLTPDGHATKANRLGNLGSSYQTRFDQLGEVADVNKAIECGVQAVALTLDGHASKPTWLNNLGHSYRTRFERLGEVPDLNRAIECGVQAVSLTPDGHIGKLSTLNNLGNSHRTRFVRLGEVEDVNKAIKCGVQVVSLTPDGHAAKPSRLNNLGISYFARFERLEELDDVNNAIECGVQAVSLTPDSRALKPGYLSNLGMSYLTRFKRLGVLEDLNKAIECGVQAVSLTPDSHAYKSMYLKNLGDTYRFQFFQSRVLSDLDSAKIAYRAAAESVVGSPPARLQACLAWARIASHRYMSSPYLAYLRAMDLLPQVVWIGNTLGQRYSLIAELGDFTTEAAAFAIGIGELERALEWLEAGRSIIWGQSAQLRTPFELLSARDPDLANQLEDIGFRLEHAGSHSSAALSSEINDADLNIEANNHIQLALEWDRLLKKARSIPGFEDFLQPPKSRRLLGAAKSHPIVVINVHKSRCDALIIQPNRNTISHVPLIELSVTSVLNAREHLVSQVRQRKIGHLTGLGSLERSLNDLWSSVLYPILEFLGYTSKVSIEELPRLTWCTTGLLSFLPLHAAGCYDGIQPNTMDLVVSSYTPTLSALLARQSATPDAHRGILAVGQEHTPGLESLPFTKDELAVVQKHAQKDSYLQLENDKSTVGQVLDAMDQFSWVHMACHGSQDTNDPTQSAFHLHDGKLTLADITKKSFTNKGLAFLSACQTATGDKTLPEEAVHLAAGMLMAGFPSVIGTMWSIADEDGPKVADKVYASLLKDGKMHHTDAARALHEAVAELREMVGERSFERWAPFIHIGC